MEQDNTSTLPMDDQPAKPTYIAQQSNNNCQQFYGPISGCVFAMPGAQVTNNPVPPQPAAPSRPLLDPNLVSAPLNTPKAMELWQLYYDDGLIDHQFKTLRSRTESALMASRMAEALGLNEYWGLFEQIFDMTNLRQANGKALESQSGWDFKERLDRMIPIPAVKTK